MSNQFAKIFAFDEHQVLVRKHWCRSEKDPFTVIISVMLKDQILEVFVRTTSAIAADEYYNHFTEADAQRFLMSILAADPEICAVVGTNAVIEHLKTEGASVS